MDVVCIRCRTGDSGLIRKMAATSGGTTNTHTRRCCGNNTHTHTHAGLGLMKLVLPPGLELTEVSGAKPLLFSLRCC